MRGGHAGVVHAHDGHTHHARGQGAVQTFVVHVVAQAIGDREGATGGGDGDQHGRDEPSRAIDDVRVHPHGGHAHVVHGGNAHAHHHRPAEEACTTHVVAGDQPQRIAAGGDGQHQRQESDADVVTQADRQAQGEHADEVHGPHADAHGQGAAGQPPAPGHGITGTHAAGGFQRRVRGQGGHEERGDHQLGHVGCDQPLVHQVLLVPLPDGLNGRLPRSMMVYAALHGLHEPK